MGHGIIFKAAICAATILSSHMALGQDECPRIDPSKKDANGIPYCPDEVKTSPVGAFSIYKCSIHQPKFWHKPKPAEIEAGKQMLRAFKDRNYTKMLAEADKLKMQVCRVEDGDDKYLLTLPKYGVKDFNAPSFILRDAEKVSKLVIIAPHVTTDYSHQPMIGVQRTKALALIMNGHRRGRKSVDGTKNDSRLTDFSHSKQTLGWHLTKEFGELFKPRVLHVHGMADGTKSLYRPMKGPLAKPFEDAIKKHTNITVFKGFNAYYEIDPPVATGGSSYYIKTEIPVRIWKNNPEIAVKIITDWETYPWAWDPAPVEPSPEPEPVETDPEPEVEEPDADEEIPEDEHGECNHEEPEPEVTPTPAPCQPCDPTASPTPEPSPPAPTPTPVADYTPPKPKPVVGTKTLTCVATTYKGGAIGATKEQCQEIVNNMVKWQTRISRGKLTMVPKVVSMDFPNIALPAKKDEGLVTTPMKQKFKSDYYILPLLPRKGGNHAGQKVAVVIQMTGWVVAHELSHLFGLGHSGKYELKPDGSLGALKPYGDNGNSYMASGNGSKFLNASQHYHLGWLAADEFAVKQSAEPETFELLAMDDLKSKGLRTVILNNNRLGNVDARPSFLSYPVTCAKACVAIHLANGGGSQLVRVITDQFSDPKTGLNIKVLEGSTSGKVRTEVSFKAVAK